MRKLDGSVADRRITLTFRTDIVNGLFSSNSVGSNMLLYGMVRGDDNVDYNIGSSENTGTGNYAG